MRPRLRDLFASTLERVTPRVRQTGPVVRLARLNTGALRAYLRYRGAVETAIGAEAADEYGEFVVAVAERDGELARTAATVLPDQLARVRPDRRPAYMRTLREVLAVRPEALPLLVRTLPDLVLGLEDAPLRAFVAQGLALHGVSAHKAESFLRRESGVGKAAARALKRGLPLSDVQRTLSLYARAHCGEDVQVRSGSGRAFSDGHHIYLPESVDAFGDERDFLLYKVQTALAAGYLEFGTFNLEVEGLPGAWPDRAPGESEVERFLRGFSNRTLARDLFQVLEDARVEARIRAAYPGVARDIERIANELRGERPHPTAPAARAVESLARRSWHLPELPLAAREDRAIAPLAALLPRVGELTVQEIAAAVLTAYGEVEALMRHVSDEPPTPPPTDGGGSSPRQRPRRKEEPRPTSTPGDPNRPYEELQSSPFAPRIAPEEAGADERRVEDEARDILAKMRAAGEEGDRGEARRRAQDHERQAAELAQVEAMLERERPHGGAVVERKDEPEGAMVGAAGAPADPDVARLGKSFVYREWDATIEDYKPGWVVVREEVLKEGNRGFVDGVMERQKPVIEALRRRFEALRPQGLVRVRNLRDGEDLDIDKVLERRMAIRTGQEPDERVYVTRHRQERDVAVAFLLDMSSSTNESADGSSRRIIDVEREALIVAAEALNAIGDSFAVWGFSGYGRAQVSFYVAKDFDEPWDDRARERVGRMSFKMENRDGAAIRHATARLRAWPARQRLLLLLSDGKPLDCGCDHYFDRYAQEDTKVALREARQAGIHPFCITVDPAGPQYLSRMYGEVAYTVIDRVEALPARLVKIYRKLAL